MRTTHFLLLAAAVGIACSAQSRIGLAEGGGDAADSSKPLKVGTELPATCSVGEIFLKVDPVAGSAETHACVASNAWVLRAGNSSSQLGDFRVSETSGTTLTVAPGVYGSGGVTYTYNGSTTFTLAQLAITSVNQAPQATLTLASNVVNGSAHLGDAIYVSGAAGSGCSGLNGLQTIANFPAANQVTVNWNSTGCTYTANSARFGSNPRASGTAYVYGDYAGNLTLVMPAAAGLIVVGAGTIVPVTIQETAPTIDSGGVPMAAVALSANGGGSWYRVADLRSFMSGTSIVAGPGMRIHPAGGVWTVGIDTSVVPELGGGNAWTGANDFRAAESTAPFKLAATPPVTCSKGQYYFNSSDSHTYACTAANIWSRIDGAAGRSSTTTETLDLPLEDCNPRGDANSLLRSASYAPQALCRDRGPASAASFDVSAATAIRSHAIVPFGWDGGEVSLYVYGMNAGGDTGGSTYTVQTQCYGGSGVSGTSGPHDASQTLTTLPSLASGYFATKLGNLDMSGCSEGSLLIIGVTKASGNSGDRLYGAYLRVVRNF